ncbi:GPI inositol-deacylase-like protein [Pyrenochaeta sp. DS3sAY3a]|nr:GPI inositol-deacylase-like protein [Pyrenochaeta sp. DS3sAY3a]
MAEHEDRKWRQQRRNPWACSLSTVATTLVGLGVILLMAHSFLTRQLDVKGCEMSWMRPIYSKQDAFSTEHTRFANKYSLYIYREGGIDEDVRVKGVPVLFIPGNAGSYKQVRSLASEAAYHYHNTVRYEANAGKEKRPLDFFAVDFNEDFTAFHGQTLLDQAEYLNDAVTYILSLYHTPGHVLRDSSLPDPTSVIIVGHSMGGVVARTMFTMPNYQPNSINTIVTLAAPHARPPLSFDGDIVRTYKGVNEYWRRSYSQKPLLENPLRHVTLISIAGGGLDTMISSEYASIESLIPETHGFTVFTSSIPNVWTGADHLAITWCDQVRKSVVRALYDVIDVSHAAQTTSEAHRMSRFKKWFLPSLDSITEKSLHYGDAKVLLTLDLDILGVSQNERVALRNLGRSAQKPGVRLLPVSGGKRFTLLSNEKLDSTSEHGALEVLACRKHAQHTEQSVIRFSVELDLSGNSSNLVKLACKNTVADVVTLPASTFQSTLPFKTDQPPFSYLQYDPEDLADYDFVAVLDKAGEHSAGWAIAEFSNTSDSLLKVDIGLQGLLTKGVSLHLPAKHPLVTEIRISAVQSSLLAYNIHVSKQSCKQGLLFAPLLRQYILDVYESKFFVKVQEASINFYGVSPYMPPALPNKKDSRGLGLQIWSDPTYESSVEVTLKVDILGSLGKLWMRYRVVFAAFPLLIVALVLRHQFRVYDATGVFMSFAQGLNECVCSSLPLAFAALTFLSIGLAGTSQQPRESSTLETVARTTTAPESHELLLGSADIFFCFLVPLLGLMCVALCVIINYVALLLEFFFAYLVSFVKKPRLRIDGEKKTTSAAGIAWNRKRILTTCVLLSLVSAVVPYHLAYAVLCLVHLASCVRGFGLAKETRLDQDYHFYNYAHSIFILMLWILPINIPVLVVWVRNLTIPWLTPFSPQHNIISIMPFVFLVETLNTGRMIPRARPGLSLVTGALLFGFGAYAAVYGVSYAYMLHHLANMFCAWLVALQFDTSSSSLYVSEGGSPSDREVKKRP